MKKQNEQFAKHRSAAYRLLAQVFLKEPTPQFLQGILDSKEFIVTGLKNSLNEQCKNSSLEQVAADIACEYANLFIGPGKHISLHESVHGGENQLWGKKTSEVLRIYHHCGFELSQDYKDLPDHLSAEFEFMAFACETEFERWLKRDTQLLGTVMDIEKTFMQEHILQWVPDVLDQIRESAQVSYYKEWAIATKSYLESDLDHILNCLPDKESLLLPEL